MKRRNAIVAALAGAALSAGSVQAGHLGYWNNSDDFYVRVSYMVDFDQQRDASFFEPPFVTGLPGAGSMYCVPTASSDLMAYIDRHGYADSPWGNGPGLEDWSDPDDVPAYNIATGYIGDMGLDMNTSATGGTNNDNNQIYNAVRSRASANLFDVCYYGKTDTWAPKASNIGNWMRQGGIVQFCYGRWNIGFSGNDLVSRDTGHCVVATKIDKRGFMNYADNEYVINYADPGSGGSSLFTQSPFAYRAEQVLDDSYFLTDEGVFRRMSRIMFGSNDGRHRLIDSALAIFPKHGWGVYPQPNQFSLVGGAFQAGNGGGGDLTTQTFDMPGVVIAAELAPDRSFASVMVENSAGGSSLYNLDLASGETTRIDSFSDPDPVMVHHRDRTLFVATDGDGSVPAQLTRIEMDTDLPPGEARLTSAQTLTSIDVFDIEFEDASDSVLVLSAGSGNGVELWFWRAEARFEPLVLDTVLTVPTAGEPNDPHYQWIDLTVEYDPATGAQPGDIVLADPDRGILTVFIIGMDAAGGPVLVEASSLDLGGPIQGLSIGDGGAVFVTRGGVVEEYEYDDVGRVISRVDAGEASPFDGTPFLGGFHISRSRTNFVAELHSGPAWENFDPSEIPLPTSTVDECPADIAQPFELLDLADINAFVAGFLAQDPIADVNADGLFDLQDVTLFIESFVAGCS